MAAHRSPVLRARAWGDLACFTRPTQKVERVTFEVPTPSAVRGLLEAILWKPAICWKVKRIHVLKPIRFISFRRNEVERRVASVSSKLIKNGGPPPRYYADEDRSQRNTVALRDVDYVFEASMELTERAGPGDNMTKFVDMFERRVRKGQSFHQPYFGCREMAAHFGPVDEKTPPAIDDDRDLGVMLWDIDFSAKVNRARVFRARLDRGVVSVPEDPEATLEPS
ncbi:MAG: type I-C CRISPR-associated protein Cas5c [Acidobacteriota bacterium]